jgi:hypothetical protein
LNADPGFLNHVFRLGGRTEHAVGHAQQTARSRSKRDNNADCCANGSATCFCRSGRPAAPNVTASHRERQISRYSRADRRLARFRCKP